MIFGEAHFTMVRTYCTMYATHIGQTGHSNTKL